MIAAKHFGLTQRRPSVDQSNRQFVGFANPTLLFALSTRQYLYTNGLAGCLGLVLSNSKGTYLAHISSENWDSYERILAIADTTVAAFTDRLGPPTAAVLCCRESSSFDTHTPLAKLLASHGIHVRCLEAEQVGVVVGSADLREADCNASDEFNGVSDAYNDIVDSRNLLKHREDIQWPWGR